MTEWQDYEEWWTASNRPAVAVFHSGPDCPSFDNPDNAVERSRNFIEWHDPRPCERCHDDIPLTRESSSCMKVLGQLEVPLHE
jgi:hypothetical protein